MIPHRPLSLLAALTLSLPFATPLAAQEPLKVLATVGMIGDIAAQVGGECTQVTTLMGPGTDPHLFTPAPSDLRALQGAEIILYGGLHLEGQLGEVLAKLGQSRPTVAVSEGAVPEERRLTAKDLPDPHVWMDPGLWKGTVPVIAAALTEARPDCSAAIASNAAAIEARIQALDDWAKTSLATIPEAQRTLVTAHDAFAYFGRAFDLHVAAIQGISTTSEAAIADIDAVADTVVSAGVPAVFVESTVNPRTIEALLQAVAAKGGVVRIGGQLYSDSMGAEGSEDGSYIGMIRHNVTVITESLGGTPAPWPEG
ncbi:metal ABC transporter solute-binding protein, Zn/Mn family [Neotabrizicola sp. sgz301269]|uniref:metal ABC transporter solute-binding protein, Zn/Mn family n=1 Tax=Neotabrizicola sp. sgz301269 TaxID=3276282 RepID=UPI00376F711C